MTATLGLMHLTAGDVLRRAASQVPDRIALIETMPAGMESPVGACSSDRQWTYAEMMADALSCAHFLLERFRPGERICLWAPNVPEWIFVQYGAALAGLVVVTANPALRSEELRHVLAQSGAVGLLHVEAFRGYDMNGTAQKLRGEVRELVSMMNLSAQFARYHPSAIDLPVVSPDDAAQIQFTSGTTGRPKGAMLRHVGLVTNAALVAARTGQCDDIIVTPMPLFHTAGSVLSVLGASTTRSTLVLPTMFVPDLMLDAVEKHGAGVMSGVPTMLAAMVEAQLQRPRDLSSLHVVLSGGAPVPPVLSNRVERAFGCPLVTVYGQTELSPIVCATSPDDPPEARAETSGLPLPLAELRIADPVDGHTLPDGDAGEIRVRGYQTMIGYVNDPAATAAAFDEEGWLRTGDLGYIDSDGRVRINGRLSDMIIRGGENVYPAEIESVLLLHPAVAGCAVFGLPDSRWGEIVAAAIILRAEQPRPDVDALRTYCRSALAPHKTPLKWFVTDELPLTASGKVQKYVLQEKAGNGSLAGFEREA